MTVTKYIKSNSEHKFTGANAHIGVKNEGEKCWRKCNKKAGPCSWCGSDGMCCRQGWTGNGCDGNVGGTNRLECTKPPPEGKRQFAFY